MKAILWTKYGPPEVLRLGEVPKPIPKDDEVLIKIHAATVTPGDCEIRRFEIHILFWLPLRIYFGIRKPKRPILGMDLAGVIEAVGKDVKEFKKGDQVFCGTGLNFGAYAEYKCQRSTSGMVIKPSNMSYGEAATLPTGGLNALHYIRKAKLQPGHKILINGAGGCFGTYAVQLAKYFGAEVTAVDSTHKLDVLSSIGADHVIDYTEEDFTKNGVTYDAIFNVVPSTSVSRGMKSLKQNGRYVLAVPDVFPVIQGLWSAMFSSKKFIIELAGNEVEDLIFLTELIEDGKIKAVVDSSYSLEQMVDAHSYVEKGEKIGHVVVRVAE